MKEIGELAIQWSVSGRKEMCRLRRMNDSKLNLAFTLPKVARTIYLEIIRDLQVNTAECINGLYLSSYCAVHRSNWIKE